MGIWLQMIMLGILLILGIGCVVLSTIALSQVNEARNDSSTSSSDKVLYDGAHNQLSYVVGLGWAIIGITVLLFIIAIVIFFSRSREHDQGVHGILNENGLFMTSETAKNIAESKSFSDFISKSKEGIDLISQNKGELDQLIVKKTNGLFGFDSIFDGFFSKAAFFGYLAVLFSFGVVSAAASVKISNTSSKSGYAASNVCAVLGIVPFSLFLVWWVADFIYSLKIDSKLKENYIDEKPRVTAYVKEHPEEVYEPRRPAPPVPTQSTTPRRRAPATSAQSTTPRRRAPATPSSQPVTSRRASPSPSRSPARREEIPTSSPSGKEVEVKRKHQTLETQHREDSKQSSRRKSPDRVGQAIEIGSKAKGIYDDLTPEQKAALHSTGKQVAGHLFDAFVNTPKST